MTDQERIMRLQDLVSEMDMQQQKVKLMAGNLDDYFNLQDESIRRLMFGRASTECDIVLDYIHEVTKLLEQVKELVNDK